jgi:hypothetical protein
MDGAPGGPLAGLQSSLASAMPPMKQGGGKGGGMNRNLNPMQFGKLGGGGEAAGGAAAGGEAAGGMAELAPLALLA